ncbi:DUF2726 domain-containing protein [Porphyrobacter sp. YT40]|uniref:DUF2726 domain-containing protein n=1 Tax=Porphyrobacter sp. YT40 TaxID=2547601 RepID=UPI001142DA83|nr:DUF2726 domain-containing protein [Porphyrobacter sp. YT40]QDH35873.1 DUF2726 domain-containing protein [Porphyrobacter sp. YT40]
MEMFAKLMNGNWSILGFVVGAILVTTILKELLSSGKKGKRRHRRVPYTREGNANQNRSKSKADHAADQLKAVAAAPFTARPLLNRSEAKVFETLGEAVSARNPGWKVMAQVSVGEFLASPDTEAFRAVNSKRIDFALMDENCCVRHAIEYQGSGHYAGTSAAARDAIKKEALRKAGIGYHEVVAGQTTPSELKALVDKLVPAQRGDMREPSDAVRVFGRG